MFSISYIYGVCIMLYVIVLYRFSYKVIWNDRVYTDIKLHYWAQALKMFKLNYDPAHTYY